MAWRMHLTNQAILHLDILDEVLAIWPRRDRVVFYDLYTGAALGERPILATGMEDRRGEAWQDFIASLDSPDGSFLPIVRLPGLNIYLTNDGRLRLYQSGATDLYLESDGTERRLDTGDTPGFVAIALDRFLGLIAALDKEGNLQIFQQHIRVGIFETGLRPQPELRASVAISRGGGAIFATDGQRIILTDSSGRPLRDVEAYYYIRQMCCSPDGHYLLTNDFDTGVLRVYHGPDLTPTHQRFAIDLLAEAAPTQLLADMPPHSVALSGVAMNDAGLIAFSMLGVLCVSELALMDELPRPQMLF